MDDDELREILRKLDDVTPDVIREARKIQQTTGGDLAQILIGLGVEPWVAYKSKAVELGCPFVDLSVYRPDPRAIKAVPEKVARRHRALPIRLDGNSMYVAMSEPTDNDAIEALSRASSCMVKAVLAEPHALMAMIDQLYGVGG